jgi:Sec-independent protein secretion pathway component TatC
VTHAVTYESAWPRIATPRPLASIHEVDIESRDRVRQALFVVLGAALFALNFGPIDAVLFPIVIAGPLITGLVMELRGWPWKLGAAAWAMMGVISLVYDWILYNEDQAFHVALTIWMASVVALGVMVVRLTRRRRQSSVR